MFRNLVTFAFLALSNLAFANPLFAASPHPRESTSGRPNIVWVIVEDMSLPFGCYGETVISTPHVDKLAADGLKFNAAFITAPVCSAARSALITGMYQTSIGAHQHRSGRGTEKIYLDDHIKLIPQIFRDAGYYTANMPSGVVTKTRNKRAGAMGKTDYNFEFDQDAIYHSNDYRGRAPGQPFFAQLQLSGGKGRTDNAPKPVNPADVILPPYYPDDAVIRQDWARYLNAAQNTDEQLGALVQRLKDDGVYDNTYIFFITDHGISHARGKQFLYEEGIRIPFIVKGPGIEPKTVRDDLIIHIDMAATSLALADIPIPAYLESKDILAPDYKQRDSIVAARDRCDETVERMRAVRTDRFKYIRNYYPDRPQLQPCAYKDKKEIMVQLRALHAAGKLSDLQDRLLFAPTRAKEELYDLKNDPFELNNLATDEGHAATLGKLRKDLQRWIEETGDRGQNPETASMYDSDMKVYVDGQMRRDPAHAKVIQVNIDQMKKWAAEGK